MDYQEYPKTLTHPGFKPARKIADAVQGSGMANPGMPEQWEPMMWPPVLVNGADDEEYYLAKGYIAPGKADAAAFSTAKASPFVPGRPQNEYPKMVNGVLVQDPDAPTSGIQEYPKWLTPPKGEPVLANSAEEEDVLLARWTQPTEPDPESLPDVAQAAQPKKSKEQRPAR